MLSARTVIATGPDTASHPGVVYHEQLAKGWERRYRRGAFKRRAAFFADNVLPLGPRRGDWIDVGCGSGHFSRMLAKEGASVLGLDGSAAMLNAARSASAGLSDVRFEPRAVENLQSLQGDRDGVLCLSVLEYLDAPEAAVAAMACALKPGGRLILSAPNSRGFSARPSKPPPSPCRVRRVFNLRLSGALETKLVRAGVAGDGGPERPRLRGRCSASTP